MFKELQLVERPPPTVASLEDWEVGSMSSAVVPFPELVIELHPDSHAVAVVYDDDSPYCPTKCPATFEVSSHNLNPIPKF